MMSRKDIAEALKARLLTAMPMMPVAWPNVPFAGRTPHLVLDWPAARRDDATVRQYRTEETGRMSVIVVTDDNEGEDRANEIADQIAMAFPSALRIEAPSFLLTINGPCDIRGGYQDDPHWRVPVMIKYRAIERGMS